MLGFARLYITALVIWALVAAVSGAIVAVADLQSELGVVLLIAIAPAVCGLLAARGQLR